MLYEFTGVLLLEFASAIMNSENTLYLERENCILLVNPGLDHLVELCNYNMAPQRYYSVFKFHRPCSLQNENPILVPNNMYAFYGTKLLNKSGNKIIVKLL